MVKLTTENISKAVERCRKLRPSVRFIADRVYAVKSVNGQSIYTVRFDVQNGEKFAECSCKAGKRKLICYHVAGAAQVNIYRQGLKRQTA